MSKTRQKVFEYVEPIGARVLVRKDEPKRQTKGGIALPDAAEIPTITGRIVAISAQIENDDDVPLRQYDKILFPGPSGSSSMCACSGRELRRARILRAFQSGRDARAPAGESGSPEP